MTRLFANLKMLVPGERVDGLVEVGNEGGSEEDSGGNTEEKVECKHKQKA